MKRYWVLCLLAFFLACNSPPQAVEQQPEQPEQQEELQSVAEEPAASFTISQELYDATLAEVKLFVDRLNALIQNKDYEGWLAALSEEFFARISSPEFLANASQSAALKTRKIVLRVPLDYFLHVVVPSRSNSRVDEIEFSDVDKVKVFYKEERTRRNANSASTIEIRRLRLYELIKKIDGTWKIID